MTRCYTKDKHNKHMKPKTIKIKISSVLSFEGPQNTNTLNNIITYRIKCYHRCCGFFWDRVLLLKPGWLPTATLPGLASRELELQVCVPNVIKCLYLSPQPSRGWALISAGSLRPPGAGCSCLRSWDLKACFWALSPVPACLLPFPWGYNSEWNSSLRGAALFFRYRKSTQWVWTEEAHQTWRTP